MEISIQIVNALRGERGKLLVVSRPRKVSTIGGIQIQKIRHPDKLPIHFIVNTTGKRCVELTLSHFAHMQGLSA